MLKFQKLDFRNESTGLQCKVTISAKTTLPFGIFAKTNIETGPEKDHKI